MPNANPLKTIATLAVAPSPVAINNPNPRPNPGGPARTFSFTAARISPGGVALGGIVACGAVYGLIGVGVIASGTRWIERLMPPVVTGVSTSLLFRSRTWRRPASTPGCRSPGNRLQRPETAAAFLATPADFGRQRPHSIVAANATVEQPDMTLNEIVAAMSNAGIEGSRTAVWRFYERHGISFQKNLVRGGAKARRSGPRTAPLDARAGHV